ncbi:MFS transporter [Chloroflexota bacterium]
MEKPRVFYGYWVLAVAFLSVFLFSGCSAGVFSLFVKPLQSDFGWGRGEIMVAFTVNLLVIALTAPFIGGLIDRCGVRGVISAGAFIAGVGFAFLNFISNLWHFYVSYATIGIGMAAMGQVPSTALVSNWFVKRRGTAIGIMSVGVGAGVLVLAPIVGGYLLPNYGWRISYLALAILTWLFIPLVLLIVKTRPSDLGLYPDGEARPASNFEGDLVRTGRDELNLKMALGTSAFWLIIITFFINAFSGLGVIQNQAPHLQDMGFPLATATAVMTGVGLGSSVGKFIFGWLCDRIQPKYACAISFGFLAVGTILSIQAGPTSSLAFIWLYAIVLGLGGGGWLPTMSMLVNNNFGLASYGAVFGAVTLVQSSGGAFGPLFVGFMYDAMGTYHWAFVICLALYAIAIPAVLAIRRPKVLAPGLSK